LRTADRFEEARERWTEALARLERAGYESRRVSTLTQMAWTEVLAGNLGRASELLDAADRLAAELGADPTGPRLYRAHLAAVLGDREAVRAAAMAGIAEAEAAGNTWVAALFHRALGMDALSRRGRGPRRGRPPPGPLAAALDLGILEPNWIRVEADLVEALAGAGDPDDAAAALIAFDGRAATARLPWAVTAVARSRAVGRLAADDPAGALAALDEAAGASTALPLAVERGRFHLVRGAALRRLRRIREHGPRSSRRLRCSRRTGSAVEAGPGRARPPRRPGGSGLALTPAEHQVAALAAAGRSNRESRRCSS